MGRSQALNKQELAILALWDKGDTIERIAIATGTSPAAVRNVLGRYQTSSEERNARRQAEFANEAFIARIRDKMPHLLTAGGGE